MGVLINNLQQPSSSAGEMLSDIFFLILLYYVSFYDTKLNDILPDNFYTYVPACLFLKPKTHSHSYFDDTLYIFSSGLL